MDSNIVILHQSVPHGATADEKDVLDQVNLAQECLGAQYDITRLSADLDLSSLRKKLLSLRPSVVVNLVESLEGDDGLADLIPALLEQMKIPFTGNSRCACVLANDKILAKELMKSAGLPTAAWENITDSDPSLPYPFIVKSSTDHASAGIDDSNVFFTQKDMDKNLYKLRERLKGKKIFAERYIEGREFNLSILEYQGRPRTLPVAEMRFVGYEAGKPRIVGYDAKWNTGTSEYNTTIRSFEQKPEDKDLIAKLEKIALECWKTFRLGGYARVDFRVDENSNPVILEVNTNPCLSSDAGFIAAASVAGLTPVDVFQSLVRSAVE
jgi:D-alanine-D-alanine ligase